MSGFIPPNPLLNPPPLSLPGPPSLTLPGVSQNVLEPSITTPSMFVNPAMPITAAQSIPTNQNLSMLDNRAQTPAQDTAQQLGLVKPAEAKVEVLESNTTYDEPVVSLIVEKDLANAKWWKNGITGNPHLKRIAPPVTFKILLSELSPSRYLPNAVGSNDPLELRLNCSLSQVQQKMKHVVQKANSRTGFHLTFWGMEPDVITGSGSTGVFMNYFGVSHIMSTNNDGEYSEKFLEAFEDTPAIQKDVTQLAATISPLRVVAQDAFIELLSLFKNNGVIRFKSDNYTAEFDTKLQLAANVWSSQYGGSGFQQSVRQNDVMNKGSVIMTYAGNIFQGYFKNFSWTMDADSPFHWKFDFTFQVQRTITFIYYNE